MAVFLEEYFIAQHVRHQEEEEQNEKQRIRELKAYTKSCVKLGSSVH